MMPTDAPSSAAARAARCPARPAPMTRTSCWGIREGLTILCEPLRRPPWGLWLARCRRRLRAAGRLVHSHPVAAGVLGLVHGGVGAHHEALGVHVVVLANRRHAQAGGGPDGSALQLHPG